MDRIHHPSAIATPPPVDAHATPGYPTEGNPGGGVEATIMTAYIGHSIIEEIRNVVAGYGVAPDKATLNQMLGALRRAGGGNATLLTVGTTLTPDHAGVVDIAISAAQTLTLPAANAANGRPFRFEFIRTDTTAFTATIQRAGADTIEGLTSITIPAGGRIGLVSDGVATWRLVAAVGLAQNVVISTTTTTTVPGWARTCRARVWGGGGGGGGVSGPAASCVAQGGGGAGYAERTFAVTPGASIVCTVGAGGAGGVGLNNGASGGASSVGAFASATGGSGGATTSGGIQPTGGAGGTASGGDWNLGGAPAQSGTINGGFMTCGVGGGSFGSGYGPAVTSNTAVAGNNAVSPGMGGNGALGGTQNGGAGANGLIILEWMP